MSVKQLLTRAALWFVLPIASANAAAYFSQTTTGSMGDATTWGDGTGLTDGDTTNDSVILELFFDYTAAAAAEAGPLLLWEAGDTSGSSLTIKGDTLLFASRHNNNQESVYVTHGLTAPQDGVQVVTVIDLVSNLSSIYINGSFAGSGTKNENDWSGGESAALGTGVVANQTGARPHTFETDWGSPIGDYPDAANANFSFNAYLLADNDLNAILVPEPSSVVLLGFGGLLLARRRR